MRHPYGASHLFVKLCNGVRKKSDLSHANQHLNANRKKYLAPPKDSKKSDLFLSYLLNFDLDQIQIRNETKTMTHRECRPPLLHPPFSCPKNSIQNFFCIKEIEWDLGHAQGRESQLARTFVSNFIPIQIKFSLDPMRGRNLI